MTARLPIDIAFAAIYNCEDSKPFNTNIMTAAISN